VGQWEEKGRAEGDGEKRGGWGRGEEGMGFGGAGEFSMQEGNGQQSRDGVKGVGEIIGPAELIIIMKELICGSREVVEGKKKNEAWERKGARGSFGGTERHEGLGPLEKGQGKPGQVGRRETRSQHKGRRGDLQKNRLSLVSIKTRDKKKGEEKKNNQWGRGRNETSWERNNGSRGSYVKRCDTFGGKSAGKRGGKKKDRGGRWHD